MIVRIFDWDGLYNVESCQKELKEGDKIVVEHEWGDFLATVLIPDKEMESDEKKVAFLRVAGSEEVEIFEKNKEEKRTIIKQIKEKVREEGMPIKVIDCDAGIDGSGMVVAFVADGRVDFRNLARDLSARFNKSVRLQQIGSRDEARRFGSLGICGKELCCRKFPGGLKSISSDMAKCQLISHRGSDRISGVCGRLMCCLAFEADQYKEMAAECPSCGEVVEYQGKRAKVVDVYILKGVVKLELEDESRVLAKKEEIKRYSKGK